MNATNLTQTDRDALPSTILELLGSLTPERDARVVRCHGTLACITMDDDGYGEFERVCSDAVAGILVRAGVVRDAR